MRHAKANVKDKADKGKETSKTSSRVTQNSCWQGEGWNNEKWKKTGNGDGLGHGMGWDGPRTRLPSLITILINLFK